jgi:hypothetical protein
MSPILLEEIQFPRVAPIFQLADVVVDAVKALDARLGRL